MMLLISSALSAGFVFALRSQINAHRLGQAEEKLKVKLDEYASQQQFLALNQQRAINTGESDRAGRLNGLDQLKLDRSAPMRSALVQGGGGPAPEVPAPVKAPSASLADRPNVNGQKDLRSIRRPDKSGSPAKAAKAAKIVKVEKSVKPSAAANKAQAQVAKAKKQSNNQRQSSRSQQRR